MVQTSDVLPTAREPSCADSRSPQAEETQVDASDVFAILHSDPTCEFRRRRTGPSSERIPMYWRRADDRVERMRNPKMIRGSSRALCP